VEDDEVVFTLRAPGASRVFLVGEFNNWNPTLERMNQDGDLFTLRLYLLAGVHRYKFVVDGEWGVDPDNVPRDPQRGSLLVLEERGGLLVMGSEEDVVTEAEVKLQPAIRYTGGFRTEDGETGSDQTLDFYASYENKRLRANVDFKTANDTWEVDPLRAKVWFNNGFVEIKLGDAIFEAFENDTIWASVDPFNLVGPVGIFDYNVARERKGFSFESQEILKTRIRAVYSDKFEERLFEPVTIAPVAFGGFPLSAGTDTLVYRYDSSLNDEDTWAFELFSDLGSFEFGYMNRRNRGMHPGLLADVTRLGGVFGVAAFNTREYWGADALWMDWNVFGPMSIGGGFGHSDAQVKQTAESASVESSLGEVGLGQDTTPSNSEIPLQSTKRWDGSLGYDADPVSVTLAYQWNEFDFDPFVYDASQGEIQTITLDARYTAEKWSTGLQVRYIDQDYGATPVDFHFFTPFRNFWLDWGDALDVAGQVEFDMPRATRLALTFGWNDRAYDPTRRLGIVVPLGILVTLEGVTDKFLGSIDYSALRVDGEYGIAERFYFDVHARLARYDKTSWQATKTYFASYLEAGYRNEHVEFSLGLGPDPIVLDPVPNEFRNNGWEQVLRGQIPTNLNRDQTFLLGQGLQAQEQVLESNHALKLELILFF